MTVHQLKAAPSVAIDNPSIAAKLREMADAIEQGHYKRVDQVVVLVTGEDPMQRAWYGKPGTVAELVGILTMAAFQESIE